MHEKIRSPGLLTIPTQCWRTACCVQLLLMWECATRTSLWIKGLGKGIQFFRIRRTEYPSNDICNLPFLIWPSFRGAAVHQHHYSQWEQLICSLSADLHRRSKAKGQNTMTVTLLPDAVLYFSRWRVWSVPQGNVVSVLGPSDINLCFSGVTMVNHKYLLWS